MRHNPRGARRRILELLANPPTLDFEQAHQLRITCAEPRLSRPKRDPSDEDDGKSSPHPILKEVRQLLEHGTSKLEYGRTSKEEWARYFRFANDRIVRDRESPARIIQPKIAAGPSHFINSTASRAQDWFLNELLPQLDGQAKFMCYVLGEPGAGKSTLLKYAINTNARYLAKNQTVFSRFEFMKFYRRWLKPDDNVKYALEIYISFILLRDIIRTYQYHHDDGNTISRVDLGPFSKERISKTLTEAASLRGAIDLELRSALVNAAVVIENACQADGFEAVLLSEIPHDIRVFLIAYFAQRAKLVLVVDGLDCISLEDSEFDTRRAQIMETISANSQSLTSFSMVDRGVPSRTDVPSSTIFVMRENTFYFYQNEVIDISKRRPSQFYVKELDPQVAMFNAVNRTVDKWAENRSLSDDERSRTIDVIWKVAKIAMRSISLLLQLRPGSGHIVDLFGGNIRTSFSFLERLMDWFLDEAISTGALTFEKDSSVRDIVRLMVGDEGWALLKRRNYRVMEVLLHGQEGWFENAILTRPRGGYARRDAAGSPSHLRDNGNFKGFVDNVLNYHVTEHLPNGNDHRLLEKIRVIQLLENQRLTESEVEAALRDRIGFESIDIRKTLMVLARSQMINVHVGRDPDPLFSASRRGLICAYHLAKSMSYLEHIFHRTLFPEMLVRHINDPIRSEGVEHWTFVSIRNVFVFLTYLKFVEQNPACGKPVPFALRLYEATTERVISVVEKILAATPPQGRVPYQLTGAGEARWEIIAVRAERLISNIVGHWERLGLIKEGSNRSNGADDTAADA